MLRLNPNRPWACHSHIPPCAQVGPYRKYDPFTKSFMSLVPGQGHVSLPPIRPLSHSPLLAHRLHACACAVRPGRDPGRRAVAPWRVGLAQGTHRTRAHITALLPRKTPITVLTRFLVHFSQAARESMVSLELAQYAALPLKQSHVAFPHGLWLTHSSFPVQARADGVLGALKAAHPRRTSVVRRAMRQGRGRACGSSSSTTPQPRTSSVRLSVFVCACICVCVSPGDPFYQNPSGGGITQLQSAISPQTQPVLLKGAP